MVAFPWNVLQAKSGEMTTQRPAILVTRRLPAPVEDRLRRDFAPILADAADRPPGRDAILVKATAADALLVTPTERIDAALIAALPARVRAVATFSVGHDHIDLAAARERGLIVANTPGVTTEATAELTMLLILAAARRAGEGERLLRAGRWTGWAPTQLLGTGLRGRRLGVFGMGAIGRETARLARGFGMDIHYRNRTRLAPGLEAGAIFHDSPESLLAVADVLALCCPATPETIGFLNAERIARLPDGAIVVNTSRGVVVDDEALIAALRSGKLAAAGLDVYAGEPDLHPSYRELDNAVLLPHLGTATQETRVAMGMRALDNLDAVFAGREPPNRLV